MWKKRVLGTAFIHLFAGAIGMSAVLMLFCGLPGSCKQKISTVIMTKAIARKSGMIHYFAV